MSLYTASTAFLETLKLGGIDVVFTNLGSDHPALVEAMAIAKKGVATGGTGNMPTFHSVPHEFVAMSAAQGFYQATGTMAAVLLHVDCGLQNSGGAIHNLFRARIPVVVFSGLSPLTQDGELRGTRSEFIHWVQDTHDQPGIVRGYSKYSYEFRTGRNIAQVTLRAMQIAMTEPRGPVYLFGAREIMEEDLPTPPRPINLEHWQPASPGGLDSQGIKSIIHALVTAKNPIIVSSWIGNSESASQELFKLVKRLWIPVLDATPFTVSIPTTHELYVGSHWNNGGQNPALAKADVVLVLDTDTPWTPIQNKPSEKAFVIHLDQDPLKLAMPFFEIPASIRYTVSTAVALRQINEAMTDEHIDQELIGKRRPVIRQYYESRKAALEQAAIVPNPSLGPASAAVALAALRACLPEDSFILSETITNYSTAFDHLAPTESKRYVTSGASSLGYHGGAAVGAKLAFKMNRGRTGTDSFVCAVTGDGSYLFSIPSVVQHLGTKLGTPFLTVILGNGGWKAPRVSTLLVHPEGYASRASGLDIGVFFGERSSQPDYVGIGVAGAGGSERAFGATVISGSEGMTKAYKQAVEEVQNGKSAIVYVQIPDLDS